ncbi:MAG: hypothetical protein GHCLOJNM_02041 [bacterium]|nr:hypothetical protein [bacterium]
MSTFGLALRFVAFEGVLILILFGSAGRIDLPWFWAVIAIHSFLLLYGLSAIDPDLRKERFHPGKGGIDRNLRFLAMPMIQLHLVIAGLDMGRYQWSPPLPLWAHLLGLLIYTLGSGCSFWAMGVNRFFSPVVRIQSERGHHLITDGPYRFVRHPGYTGILVGLFGEGLALGSLWSLAPLVPCLVLFFRRVILEDRFLHEHLEGYPAYAARVRYRLLPGVW